MKTKPIYHRMKHILMAFALILIAGSCQFESEKPAWKPAEGLLLTKWAVDVTPESVLPEYPRPQMVREEWINLNGLWDYAIVPASNNKPEKFDGEIMVPFCPESALSGIGKSVGPDNRLWYRRKFELPVEWAEKQIMLNFGASDWETRVWINGTEIGSHRGGYDSFTFDITGALKDKGHQEIIISVWDPVDQGTQPRGKQVLKPEGIWYTSVTGIWQTVWLEPLSKDHIKSVSIIPDIDNNQVTIVADLSGEALKGHILDAKVSGEGQLISEEISELNYVVIQIDDPVLWTPEYPFLYDFRLNLVRQDGMIADSIEGYFGMRKISLGKDDKGYTRMMLNDEFVFQFGPLDQGWWPDGLYTAPTDEALKYDIEVTKKLGFNMARKHVKAEPDRWYYWCDKLGLLVWQDMPSGDAFIGRDDPDIIRTEESEKQFRFELKELIMDHFNHPSIVVWVPFNEGWGQSKTGEIVNYIREIDTTRLVNSASGWTDRNVGDIRDIHVYPGPAMPEPEEKRAIVLGEFGGLGLPLEGHTWQNKDNWGYKSFDSQEKLLEAYTGLIDELMPMVGKGLSAAVYTQTSDVEIEVNGLMTYDRAVIKMDPSEIYRMNKGLPHITKALPH
jgi:beta-galactosidase/beta-glucuronidase